MKGVQCYELSGGIALNNHALLFLSASSNDNLIDLSNDVGEDKASHRVISGDFVWIRIQWNHGCGFLPDTCSIDDREQRFLNCVDDNFFKSACQLSDKSKRL